MQSYYGEAQVLYIVFFLNCFAIAYKGWLCGEIYSDLCLKFFDPYIPITLACLVVTTVFTLIAGLLQTLSMFKQTEKYILASRILTMCAAIFGIAGIFYYYDHLGLRLWGQHIAGFTTGMIAGVAVYQLANILYEKLENRKTA